MNLAKLNPNRASAHLHLPEGQEAHSAHRDARRTWPCLIQATFLVRTYVLNANENDLSRVFSEVSPM